MRLTARTHAECLAEISSTLATARQRRTIPSLARKAPFGTTTIQLGRLIAQGELITSVETFTQVIMGVAGIFVALGAS